MTIPLLTSPFRNLVVGLGALPSEFEDSMTYYEALCWIIKYLEDTIISKINEIGESENELIITVEKLKLYVENYFENLDVQEEINNKLDEMAESGELRDLIASILQSNIPNSPVILGYSFKSEGPTYAEKNWLVYSTDLKDFKVHDMNIGESDTRDASIFYDTQRHIFYLIAEATDGENSMYYRTSEDLATWSDKNYFLIGEDYVASGNIWSPTGFYDSAHDKYVISFSYLPSGSSIRKIVLFDMTPESMTISNIRDANLVGAHESTSYIDPYITKKGDYYYMIAKSDGFPYHYQVYSSTDLNTFNIICANILDSTDEDNVPIFLEGGSIFVYNNMLYMTAYAYYGQGFCETFTAWSEDGTSWKFGTTNLDDNRFVNTKCIVINDTYTKSLIRGIDFVEPNPVFNIKRGIDVPSDLAYSSFDDTLTIVPNHIIRVYQSKSLALLNPFGLKEFQIQFMNSQITLTITSVDGDTNAGRAIKSTTATVGKIITCGLRPASSNYDSAVCNLKTWDSSKLHIGSGINASITTGKIVKNGPIVSFYCEVTTSGDVAGYKASFITIDQSIVGEVKPLLTQGLIISNLAPTSSSIQFARIIDNGTIQADVPYLSSGKTFSLSGSWVAA